MQKLRGKHNVVSLLVLCLPLNAATPKPQVSNRPAGQLPEVETPVVFEGLQAALELPPRTLESFILPSDAGTTCASFTIVPYGGVIPAVQVTASGLGSVAFFFPSQQRQKNRIEIPELQSDGTPVNFCVDGNSLLQPGSSLQGNLIAFATGFKPARATIKIQRPSLAKWIMALGWFVAILLPAALTGIFGVVSAWATSGLGQRRDQKTAFRKMKDDKWEDLVVFFQTHLGNVLAHCDNRQELARSVRSELQNRGFWTSIPWRERDRIDQFVKGRDGQRLMSELAILFREWEKDIREIHI